MAPSPALHARRRSPFRRQGRRLPVSPLQNRHRRSRTNRAGPSGAGDGAARSRSGSAAGAKSGRDPEAGRVSSQKAADNVPTPAWGTAGNTKWAGFRRPRLLVGVLLLALCVCGAIVVAPRWMATTQKPVWSGSAEELYVKFLWGDTSKYEGKLVEITGVTLKMRQDVVHGQYLDLAEMAGGPNARPTGASGPAVISSNFERTSRRPPSPLRHPSSSAALLSGQHSGPRPRRASPSGWRGWCEGRDQTGVVVISSCVVTEP